MNKENLLIHIKDADIKQELKNILDICNNARVNHITKNTKFLTPNIISLANDVLIGIRDINFRITSLNEDAERKIIYFFKDYVDFEDVENVLSIVKISHNSDTILNHRDYLGSILSLGIEREFIGDILVENNCAFAIVLKPIDEFLLYNLEKVRNQNVSVSIETELPLIDKKLEEITINISSMRLDSLISKFTNLSREKAQYIVKSGNVRVNFEVCKNNSKFIEDDSVIAVRGYGKFVVAGIISETKKQRLRVLIKKYSN